MTEQEYQYALVWMKTRLKNNEAVYHIDGNETARKLIEAGNYVISFYTENHQFKWYKVRRESYDSLEEFCANIICDESQEKKAAEIIRANSKIVTEVSGV